MEDRAWQRQVVGRARRAVSALVQALAGQGAGGDSLEAAMGAVMVASAQTLQEVGAGRHTSLLGRGGSGARGERLWSALKDTSETEPILAGGPFGLGLERALEAGPSDDAAGPLLSLLELLARAGRSDGGWAAPRVLGTLYEAYLGWEWTAGGIRRTVRRIRDLGAVYTPWPVARFIVERTLRPAAERCESIEAFGALSVCDPACGGGAFLIEAMRLLEGEALRRGWIGEGLPDRLAWRRHIASGALNGVDIDPAAVQVARLALWVASGGGGDVARALRSSIRPGDALVGAWRADLPLRGEDEEDPKALRRSLDAWCERLLPKGAPARALHWELDFPERFPPPGGGPRGWDAVVGNPPYVGARSLRPLGAYLKARFPETYTGYSDLSTFFLHRALELLRPGGRLGFITPSYWFQNTYGEKLRRYLTTEGRLEEAVDFGPAQVFSGRGVHTAVVLVVKEPKAGGVDGCHVRYRRVEYEELDDPKGGFSKRAHQLPRCSLGAGPWVFASAEVQAILEKVRRRGRPLGELFHIEKGPTSGRNGIFTLEGEEIKKLGIERELLRFCIKNSDVRRYDPLAPKRFLLYLDEGVEIERYPQAAAYLEGHREALAARSEARRGLYPWWRLERPRRRWLFEAPAKLVVPYRASENRFTLDEAGCFNDGGDIRVLVPRRGVGRGTMLAALAVVNSSVGNLVYRCLGKPKGRMLEFFVKPLAGAPLGPPRAEWPAGAEGELSERVAEESPEALVRWLAKRRDGLELLTPALALLAERMLACHRNGKPGEDALACDRAIDALVGRLFGLTPKENALAAKEARASR